MKKTRKKKFISLVIAVVLIAMTISIVAFDERYNMRRYFNDWEQETDEKIVHILNDRYVDRYNINLENYVDGLIEEVYCIRNERIYFCYSTAVQNSYPDRIWHIASIETNGEALTEHFAGNLFRESNPLGYSYDYECLSCRAFTLETYGGIYSNNKIYLHGKDKTVVYDIDSDTVSETDGYPIGKYLWNIEDHKAITIEDTEQNTFKTVTLENMAEQNIYAKKLLKLSTKTIWSGDSPTKRFFTNVKIVDNRIYIICEALNWSGESFAVTFRYDFSSDRILFLSSKKVGDRISTNYSFVLCESCSD